jgi:hypothetical protein
MSGCWSVTQKHKTRTHMATECDIKNMMASITSGRKPGQLHGDNDCGFRYEGVACFMKTCCLLVLFLSSCAEALLSRLAACKHSRAHARGQELGLPPTTSRTAKHHGMYTRNTQAHARITHMAKRSDRYATDVRNLNCAAWPLAC